MVLIFRQINNYIYIMMVETKWLFYIIIIIKPSSGAWDLVSRMLVSDGCCQINEMWTSAVIMLVPSDFRFLAEPVIDEDGHFVQGQRNRSKVVKATVRHGSLKMPHKKIRYKKTAPSKQREWLTHRFPPGLWVKSLLFSFHTSREDFSFFSSDTQMLKWNSSFLTVSYFCQAL